jgi:hypothetical protein
LRAGDGVTLDRIYPGLDHAVAVTDEGVALSWGRNDRGQLGLGDTNDRNTPAVVTLPDTSVGLVRSACAGQFHTLLLTSTGAVLAMGGNAHGQLGTGTGEGGNATTVPTRVAALAGVEVTAVACALAGAGGVGRGVRLGGRKRRAARSGARAMHRGVGVCIARRLRAATAAAAYARAGAADREADRRRRRLCGRRF